MAADWILIADASRARLLQQNEHGDAPVLLQSFEHPASRLHSSELGDDERGRQRNDAVFGAAAYEARLEPQRKEHLRFARELAQVLEAGARDGRCATLRVFSPSPFLGELKAQFGPATRRVLAGAHDLDLAATTASDLQARIHQYASQA